MATQMLKAIDSDSVNSKSVDADHKVQMLGKVNFNVSIQSDKKRVSVSKTFGHTFCFCAFIYNDVETAETFIWQLKKLKAIGSDSVNRKVQMPITKSVHAWKGKF